jgi:hypothetical protein
VGPVYPSANARWPAPLSHGSFCLWDRGVRASSTSLHRNSHADLAGLARPKQIRALLGPIRYALAPLPSVELTPDFKSSLPDRHGPPRREIGRRCRPAFSSTGEPSVSCPGASPGLVDDVYGFAVEGLETKGP